MKAKRLERAKVLLTKLKHGVSVMLFSDEKLFQVDQVSSSHTIHYISTLAVDEVEDSIKFTYRTKRMQLQSWSLESLRWSSLSFNHH